MPALTTTIPPTAADSYDELWALLNQTAHLIHKLRQRELAPADVSVIEAAVVFVLANADGPVTPAEMSRYLLREIHSTSMLLQRMEQKGLITKVKNLHHKHLVRLTLTNKGRTTYRRTLQRDTIHHILSSISEGERKRLDRSLRKLREAAANHLGIKQNIRYP